MSEDRLAEGTITRAELAELARWFDEFQNSFDPASDGATQAKVEFNRRVTELFNERVASRFQSVLESVFRAKVRTWCREYLRRGAN